MRRVAHQFLKWFPTAVGASAISIAAVWSSARDWIGSQAVWAWGLMADPWIAATVLLGVTAYIIAILVTGREFDQRRNHAVSHMPLHQAARWIAEKSEWGAALSPAWDDKWVSLVDVELQSALSSGRLKGWGFFKTARDEPETGLSLIPEDFWRKAQWNSHHLVADEPPTHVWRNGSDGGGMYRRVVVDLDQVRALWPRRSRWAALMRRSPVERLSAKSKGQGGGTYREIWRKQDAYYEQLRSRPPYGTFDSWLEPPNPAVLDPE